MCYQARKQKTVCSWSSMSNRSIFCFVEGLCPDYQNQNVSNLTLKYQLANPQKSLTSSQRGKIFLPVMASLSIRVRRLRSTNWRNGASKDKSTFHLINGIKWSMAFLNIHIWCLWPNWGRRIHLRISIKAWFRQSYPNMPRQVRRTHIVHSVHCTHMHRKSRLGSRQGHHVGAGIPTAETAWTQKKCQQGAGRELTILARKTQHESGRGGRKTKTSSMI